MKKRRHSAGSKQSTTGKITPGDSAREREAAAAGRELEKLMAQKPCYVPFSIQSVTALASPPKLGTERSTSDVITELRKSAHELLNRASAGEPDAMKEFCWFAHNVIRQLTALAEKKQMEIRQIASTYEDWPILYTPDDTTSVQIYKELAVGTDSFVHRYAGRKIDWDNPWTNRALLVLELMRWCKERLPELIRDNQPSRKMSPCFVEVGRTKIRIYYYDTPNAIFEIPEWCELCPALPDKLRPENVDQFWKPARLAILDYWARDELVDRGSAYRDALKLSSPGKHGLCSERRGNALDGIKRAMRSLAGK
jgi:hypothetical protein